MKAICTFVVAFALAGCGGAGAILSALGSAAQAGQVIGSLLDVAEDGADAYLARHPSQELQERVAGALRRARAAVADYDRVVATAHSTARQIAAARDLALARYEELRAELEEAGVLDARAPDGGAETEAPEPVPLALPTREQLEVELGGGP